MTMGVFAVARSIWTDVDFADEPFTERQAFIWLVSEAAWRGHKARGVRGPIELKRGEVCHSLRFMGEAWDWKKDRVARFLKRMQKRGIIRDTSRDSEKVYLINNYNRFQKVGLPERDTEREVTATRPRHDRDKLETGETGKQGNTPLNTPPDLFDDFWEAFDHKKAKGQALKAWKASLKRGNDPERLIAKAAEYRLTKPDKQFMKHPASWLNADCQDDEPATNPPEGPNNDGTTPHNTIVAGLRNAVNAGRSMDGRCSSDSARRGIGATGTQVGGKRSQPALPAPATATGR